MAETWIHEQHSWVAWRTPHSAETFLLSDHSQALRPSPETSRKRLEWSPTLAKMAYERTKLEQRQAEQQLTWTWENSSCSYLPYRQHENDDYYVLVGAFMHPHRLALRRWFQNFWVLCGAHSGSPTNLKNCVFCFYFLIPSAPCHDWSLLLLQSNICLLLKSEDISSKQTKNRPACTLC